MKIISSQIPPIVLALSGSLREPSFTEKMLNTLLKGMGKIELHKFYPHKMNIGPCTSCWSCWLGKHKGECIQKDDFQKIFNIYKKCDYFIIATPVYVYGYTATIKNVLDRFFINLDSTQILLENKTTHHPHRFTPNAKGVLVSSCGFPDMDNFSLLSQHFKRLIKHSGLIWAGEVLIPTAGAANVPRLYDENLESIKKAGSELFKGVISQKTMQAISDVPISKEEYIDLVNARFKGGITGRAKAVSIGIKVLRKKAKRK